MSDPIETTIERAVRAAAMRRDLARRLALGNLDELLVLDLLLQRLELGRNSYGFLDLAKTRDWSHEEAEELLDARIYQACDVIQRRSRETFVAPSDFLDHWDNRAVSDRFDVSDIAIDLGEGEG